MRALVQRVTHAQVDIDGKTVGSCERGYLILLGVGADDGPDQIERLWSKIFKLRIFEDESGKTNRSLADVDGQVLIVSQFTLYANCKKGNRPSFTGAGAPDQAERLYEQFVERARQNVPHVETGRFGAMMQISLVNDGPFTIWLDTDGACGGAARAWRFQTLRRRACAQVAEEQDDGRKPLHARTRSQALSR
ncbi:MAG: D-aminoacyl-tRNA deacylase [Senegalimassilia anaerobia]